MTVGTRLGRYFEISAYKMLQDVTRCHKMSQDVTRCYKMLQDVTRPSETQDLSEVRRTPPASHVPPESEKGSRNARATR